MYKNIFGMLYTFSSTRWTLGQHWQSIVGLSICCLFIFSTYSRAYGFYIDAIEETTFDESALAISQLEQVSTDTLLIGMAPGFTPQTAERFLDSYGPKGIVVEKFWPEFNIALIRIPKLSDLSVRASSTTGMQQLEQYRQEFEQVSSIRYADYNGLISIPLAPSPLSQNDTNESRQISTQQARDIQQNIVNDQEIVVAVIDSGYDTTDKDPNSYSLWENQAEIDGLDGVDDDGNGYIDDIHGWNWSDDNNIIDDAMGHGTVVIDTLLNAVTDLGGDRLSVKIQSLQVLKKDGKGEIVDLIEALSYALRTGTPIVNISLVSYYNSPPLEEAIKILYDADVLMFSSINNLCDRPYYPAAYPETLAITSVDWATDHCTTAVADIAIPDDTETLLLNSYASAHAVAVTTQMLLQHPEWSNSMIKPILLSTADYISDESPRNIFLRTDLAILNAQAALKPGLMLDPPVLDFGSILTGTQKTVSLQVTNIATQTETYQLDTGLSTTSCLSDQSIGILDFDKQSFTLEPTQATTIEVTFDSNNQNLGSHVNLINMVSQYHNLDIPAWGRISVDISGDGTPLPDYEFDRIADVQIDGNTSTALIDDTMIYTISVVNQDTNSLQNVIVEGYIPNGTIFVPEQSSPAWQEQDGNLKVVLDNIPLDGSAQLHLAVQVDQELLDSSDGRNYITYISFPKFTLQISDCTLSSIQRGGATTIVRDLDLPYGSTEERAEGVDISSNYTLYFPIITR